MLYSTYKFIFATCYYNQRKAMQINDIRVQKFNKISNLNNLSSPEILSNLCILEKLDYAKNIKCFKTTDKNGHNYQLYITRLQPRPIINEIVYLKDCPKIFFLKGEPESLIIQENVFNRLNEYLIFHQANSLPYLDELEAKKIIEQVSESLQNYLEYKILYDCISHKNVMMGENGKWQLSAVGLLMGVDKDSPQYSVKEIKQTEHRITFALGCLLFKLVFGFSPIISNTGRLDNFSFANYLKLLQLETNQKLLKVYHFSQRILQLSPECMQLIQGSLSGKMPFTDWFNHIYFKTRFTFFSKVNNKNKQIMMINSVEPNSYSLIMSAIDYKKNHQLERLNQKAPPSPEQQTFAQIIESLQKHTLFKNLAVAQENVEKQSRVRASNNLQESGPISIEYFYNDWFDPQQDYPCRQFIKLIENEQAQEPARFKDPSYQAKLKLYGYPYALAFELLKVERQQPVQIRRKIKALFHLLMQISALNYCKTIKPLHNTELKFSSFQEIKPTFRQNINELYQYFLNEAMRKYNCKNDSISMVEKVKKKQKGLEYYRLCLKLLQGSLIYRKGGYDLNLARIQTSQRKQIENDLEQLLAKYFPRKPEIH